MLVFRNADDHTEFFRQVMKAKPQDRDGAERPAFSLVKNWATDGGVLQTLMLNQDAKTTRHYINVAERMRRQRTADTIHVPDVLAKRA